MAQQSGPSAPASWRPGVPGIGGGPHHQADGPGYAQPSAARRVLENWMTALTAFGRTMAPRAAAPGFLAGDYTAQDYNRTGPFPSALRPFPYPYVIGAVAGFMPLQDLFSLQTAWGKTPFGPGVNTPIPAAWQISYPQLPKVTG